MNKKLLAMYGLKWNPFSPEVPVEGLKLSPNIESFAWRVENLAREGGFALLTGAHGQGKSATLRALVDRLGKLPEVRVGQLTRPQAAIADFYRELGDVFGVQLTPHNRWSGAKVLRQRWLAHIDAALFRPVLVIDEAQELLPAVLKELRLLSSADLDSRLLLTVVLAGDMSLAEKLRNDDLALSSRMRVRLTLEPLTPEALVECMRQVLTAAGNAKLMTHECMVVLAEHAAGNLRALMQMAEEMLAVGAQREVKQLDEKLYLEVFAIPATAGERTPKREQAARRR